MNGRFSGLFDIVSMKNYRYHSIGVEIGGEGRGRQMLYIETGQATRLMRY